MKKLLTLCIIHQDGKVLLGMKKRGFGVGKWNGFGGKVEAGEAIEDAAKRELFEEVGLNALDLQKLGVLDFSWAASAKASASQAGQVLQVHIFKCTKFDGQPMEGEEMKPQWFLVSEIPFEKMWSNDKYFYPLFLENKKFEGRFVFGEGDDILEYELHEIRGSL